MVFKYRGWLLALYFIPIIGGVIIVPKDFNLAGILLVFLGSMLRLTAGLYIHGGTNKSIYNAEKLASSGIYNITRNPLYLSNMITAVGILYFANIPNLWFNYL